MTRKLDILRKLYGSEKGLDLSQKIDELICEFRNNSVVQASLPVNKSFQPDQSTSVLITYGDMVKDKKEPPLKTLHKFLNRYAKDTISTVHILPFFPYSSDDGFSVIDFKRVDPRLGVWDDIESLSEDFKLCFDAVFNHSSSQHKWFSDFLDCKNDFYISVKGNEDLSEVIRPRTSPLITEYQTNNGGEKVWTTFSSDQVDLNFKSTDLLIEMVKIFLLYLQHGAKMIRLDAIAFIWKEIGTTCLHLEEAHLIVKLFRAIVEETVPETAILTETNVPHEDNISYFGEGDEAHLVYQFTLAPLVAHAILREDSSALNEWAKTLEGDFKGTFFNFLASHDGIGLNPARGYIPESEINFMVSEAKRKGGDVSCKNMHNGSELPYELNINYFSFLDDGNNNNAIKKFLLAHSIMMCMPGIPAIYFHSLFGSENYSDGVKQTGRLRSLNREKVKVDKIISEIEKNRSVRNRIYNGLIEMLNIRKSEKSFSPDADFKIIEKKKNLMIISRDKNSLFALHNISSETISIDILQLAEGVFQLENMISLKKQKSVLILEPWEFKWFRNN